MEGGGPELIDAIKRRFRFYTMDEGGKLEYTYGFQTGPVRDES